MLFQNGSSGCNSQQVAAFVPRDLAVQIIRNEGAIFKVAGLPGGRQMRESFLFQREPRGCVIGSFVNVTSGDSRRYSARRASTGSTPAARRVGI
jgi:hypothetical protein